MPEVVIENQQDASRYALLVDGELVSVLDYRILDAQISFPRTFTLPQHRGHGWAEKLVEFAVDGSHSTARGAAVHVAGPHVIGEPGRRVVGGAAVVEQRARQGVGDQPTPHPVRGHLAGE